MHGNQYLEKPTSGNDPMRIPTLKFVLALIVFLLTVHSPVLGGSSAGMTFLLTGPSAWNMGASEAHTAALTGPSGIFLNPSLLALEYSSSVSASYMIWPATDTQNHFAGALFRRNRDAFGVALLSSVVDDIPFRSGPTQSPDGYFAVRYMALAASYARSHGPVSAGVTGMYLYEQFFRQDAVGLAFNAGLALSLLDERVRLGAAVRNIGSMSELSETATVLPAMLSLGADVQLLQFSTSALDDEIPFLWSVSTDYVQPLADVRPSGEPDTDPRAAYVNIGTELNIAQLIDLRAGYRSGDTQRRFSFGIGVSAGDFYISYAYMPFKTGFGNAHAIGLQFYFR